MFRLTERVWVIASLAAVTPLGFASKFYDGPGAWWFNDYGAGVLYEVFWCLVLFLVWPLRRAAGPIAAAVFVATAILEVLQLSDVTVLRLIRSTFLGRMLIGTTFVWWDFPHYALGCVVGWGWMRGIAAMQDRVERWHVHQLPNHAFGPWAERQAGKYLMEKGLRIVTRNYRTGSGEIDIIARDGRQLVFVEVKAERSERGEPQLKVDAQKRRRMRTTARSYVSRYRLEEFSARFDVVTIQADPSGRFTIEHEENAFEG